MADQKGLESALEFTKFVITLDSGLIAFVTGTSFLAHIDELAEKVVIIAILLILAVSLLAGIAVYMRAASMFSEGNYDLGDRHLKVPGMINVIAFAAGAIGVGTLAIVELVLTESPAQVQQSTIENSTG